jgi:hypothetical protein
MSCRSVSSRSPRCTARRAATAKANTLTAQSCGRCSSMRTRSTHSAASTHTPWIHRQQRDLRLAVDNCPSGDLAGVVGRTGDVTIWTYRSRSGVFSRCSMARAGDPFASYQSAARRCSFATISGSARRSSYEQELAVERVVAEPLTIPVGRDQE